MSRCITITKSRTLSFSSRVSFGIFGLAPIYLNRIPQQIACYASEASKEKTQLPQPTPKKGTVSARVSNLVEQIASLTLIETAELVQELKSRLNIQDVALPAMNVVAAAPVAEAPKVEEIKAPEKVEFTVKLEKYEATAKTKIIREIKSILPGMNLVEAKKFVESAPKVIKENVNKDEAEKIKKTLEGFGATIILE